jgi:hypothetical protein
MESVPDAARRSSDASLILKLLSRCTEPACNMYLGSLTSFRMHPLLDVVSARRFKPL